MHELLNVTAASLRKLAMNKQAKHHILQDEQLFSILKRAANRYIGGQDLGETLEKVIEHQKLGYRSSIEFMGENTVTAAEANAATFEFLRICDAISREELNSGLSLDLSHIGLSVSKDLCMENLYSICRLASAQNIEVTISAEGVDHTDAVLDTYIMASEQFSNLSITLQAYLHRSGDDFQELLKRKGRVRLVKGAFQTPAGLSLARGTELNDRYLGFLDRLLLGNHKCSIATHDLGIQKQAVALLDAYRSDRSLYEFESLFGIRPEQLSQLKASGHPTKVYFVYGREWFLYLCNRIAEYPLNLFTALNDMVGEVAC